MADEEIPTTPFTYRSAIEEWCFLQVPLLTLKQLVEAAHARGLLFFTLIRRGTWETLDSQELLPPVGYLPRDSYSSGWELQLLEEGHLRLRQEVGYQPWDEEHEPLYGHWQLLTLGEIATGLVPAHPLDRLEHGLEGYADFLRGMAEGLAEARQLEPHLNYWRWRELVLTRTQTLVLPKVTGHYRSPAATPGLGEDAFEWTRRQQREFDYERAAEECAITREELAQLYDQLATGGQRLDPAAAWFDLADQIKRQRREALRDNGLRALDYYRAARVIRGWHSYLTEEPLPDLAEQLSGDPVGTRRINERRYGHAEIRGNRAALPAMLETYGLYPWRVQLLVEGASEEVMLETLLEELIGASFGQLGIHPVRLGGAGIPKKLDRVLGAVRTYANYYLLVFDNEGKVTTLVDELRRAGHIEQEPETHIWDQDIEADNFTVAEICGEIRKAAKGAGVEGFRLQAREVDRAKARSRKGLASVVLGLAEERGFVYSKPKLAHDLARFLAEEVRARGDSDRPLFELTQHLYRMTVADRRLRGRLREAH